MPTCASESLSRAWQSNESIHAGSISSSSSGFHSPNSSSSFSPVSTSPDNTLRRKRRIQRASTTGHIRHEPFTILSDRESRSQSPDSQKDGEEDNFFSIFSGIIGWYPCLLLCCVRDMFLALVPHTIKQIIFAVPMMWISMWIWCFTQVLQLPLTLFKLCLSIVLTPKSERNRKKRTVLISGGSTIQALHLARNFYSAGARVIVCEVTGIFALTRFSTAVSKFYTLPKPNDQLHNYVKTLCEIVDKEDVLYYVPVSATTTAYYDAVAKPRLENLGCSCFCPDVEEIWALDDTLEVMKICQKYKIPTPNFYSITSRSDIHRLYDTGAIRFRNIMSAAGPGGLREKCDIVLPLRKSELKIPSDISELRPWVVVQDVEGDHYSTCTTVKGSKVVANVTCLMDPNSNGLMPVEHKEIDQWLENFFSKLHLLRPITGHISFSFVVPKDGGGLIPLSSRVCVSLPYICYTNVHPRLVWRPCKHFSRQNSGPLVCENGSYCFPETVITTIKNPSIKSVTRLIGTVLDKREALFAIWDPLPYCAYYHMQIPFKNILGFLQRRQDSFTFPVTTPVR